MLGALEHRRLARPSVGHEVVRSAVCDASVEAALAVEARDGSAEVASPPALPDPAAGCLAAAGRALWAEAERRVRAVEGRFWAAEGRFGAALGALLSPASRACRASLTRSSARSPADEATCSALWATSFAAFEAASAAVITPASP